MGVLSQPNIQILMMWNKYTFTFTIPLLYLLGGETWVWSNVVNAGFCYGSMGVLAGTALKEPVHTMRLNTSTRKDSVINSDREGGNFEEKEEKKKDCFW